MIMYGKAGSVLGTLLMHRVCCASCAFGCFHLLSCLMQRMFEDKAALLIRVSHPAVMCPCADSMHPTASVLKGLSLQVEPCEM